MWNKVLNLNQIIHSYVNKYFINIDTMPNSTKHTVVQLLPSPAMIYCKFLYFVELLLHVAHSGLRIL